MSEYLLSNAWERERERLTDLEANWDPGTIRHLEEIGVGRGWRCLEVGGGGGSMTRWLAQRVGSEGKVIATDIDTRFLDTIEAPNVEVRRHDIVAEDLEQETYDLVHSRLLLEHLPDNELALKKMVAALKPGGWILLEDYDWAYSTTVTPMPAYDRAIAACLKMVQAGGYDELFGRMLPKRLAANGLTDVGAEGRVTFLKTGLIGAEHWRLSLEQWGPRLVDSGLLTQEDLTESLALWDDQDFAAYSFVMISARGRKPL